MSTAPTPPAELVTSQISKLLDSRHSGLTDREFWAVQYDLGLAWVHFPVGLGGLGVSPSFGELVSNSLLEAGAPANFGINPIGIGMGAPTIAAYGSPELCQLLLRPMFTCEEIWCQLFSEPGAGSDVASVTTKAVRDGEEWVIQGQKVWTTLAHVAKWGMLLARSDTSVPKHSGMTYFLVDMESPGIEVRPLRQMTGEAEFNEVYFNDVHVADRHRLGDIGSGWKVALTTLMNERVSLGGSIEERSSGAIGDALRIWNESTNHLPSDRDALARLWIEAEVGRLTSIRAAQSRSNGTPGPEGSVAKLASAELNKRIYNFCQDLIGPAGILYSNYEMTIPSMANISHRGSSDVARMFLRSRANSIEGGTSEVMKNIIGERVLGLPGEPRLDKDLPFAQTPKN